MRTKKEEEKVETLDAGPVKDRKLAPVEEQDAAATTPKGSAVKPSDDEPEGPRVRYFTVVRGGVAQVNGFRTRLKEGKEIDTLNYNIRALQRQGIRLAEIDSTKRDEPIEELL